MSLVAERGQQMFPVLSPEHVATARRFASGEPRRFAAGEELYAIGEENVPAWLVLEGEMRVVRRDGLDRQAGITTHGRGQISGEVAQLSGRPSLAGAHAGAGGCTALPFDAAHLRALIVGSADVGEAIMRAYILRRVALIEDGGAGSVLIGVPGSRQMTRIDSFLARNGYPHTVLDSSLENEGRALVERLGVLAEDLPLMVCPNGMILKHPTEQEIAACLGMVPQIEPGTLFDVVVVGAGPAGLAASVYAASEGLSVLTLDERAFGGQAGASARIENYLGFPTGISGKALAGRALNQALKFGAVVAIPLGAQQLECAGDPDRTRIAVELSEGRVHARTVVIASGARYRRPDVPEIAAFESHGISYWASAIEAKLCEGEEVALVGGGNSAGQAVVFLAAHVKLLHLVVRRELSATMSRYLIDRIEALSNVEIHVGCELDSLEGDGESGLTAATFRHIPDGRLLRRDLRHLFLFIGADPNTDWLDGCVTVDPAGFVVTGGNRLPLETSQHNVFAIGDVRAGSTKRVAAAVGEGAAVVAQIHLALAKRSMGRDEEKGKILGPLPQTP